ncbi:Thioredoxin- transmembrane protein 1 [Entomophthora muscae]|uniref:Thioredoxin- transmembrane protein 1 n=1 Tax=Entomophthora muscae TaxID=34485 RepID=A0ACC2S1J9_9FUNG|nr:Thioredoxin- transmembrane protein 1 [Entomophthora muscae]
MLKLNFVWLLSALLCSIGITLGDSVDQSQDVSAVLELNDSNFYQLLTPSSEWVIAFTAKWCSACNSFKPEYENLAAYFNVNDPSIRIARIDIEESPALANQFFITYLPTLFHLKNSDVRSLSELPRNTESMKTFLLEKKWQKTYPAYGFFAPFSIYSRGVFIVMSNIYKLVKFVHSLPTTVVLMFPGILVGIGLYYISKSPATTSGTFDKKEN